MVEDPRCYPTVGELFRYWAMRRPRAECVVDRGSGRRVTFGEMEERTNRLGHLLMERGCAQGGVVALRSENSAEVVEVFLAAAKVGAIVMPLNTRLVPGELAPLLERGRPRLAFEGGLTPILSDAADSSLRVVTFGEEYESHLARQSSLPGPILPRLADPFLVLFTSGSTGQPKGSVSTHGNHFANMTNVAFDYFSLRDDDVALNIAPMFFSASLMGTIFPFIMRGLKVTIEPRIEVGAIVEAIEAEGCTCTQLVPTVLYRLLAQIDETKACLTSLRRLGYGSAPIPPARLAEAIEGLGRSIFVQGYGATETSFATVLRSDDHSAAKPERLKSCGRPVSAARVDLRSLDGSRNEVPEGQAGEVVITGPVVTPGYWEDKQATVEAFDGDWFRTGDVAIRDADGYFYIVDRVKDMLISGGINIFPREVENVISTLPAVSECAVIGVPDSEWGESVKAFIVARPAQEVSVEEVHSVCRANLASYKKPRSVEVVESLPHTATGKIDKRALRRQYWPTDCSL